jgi:hypothetical protein
LSENPEPSRKTLLKDNELPIVILSKTERDELKRTMPYKEIVLPILARLRRLRLEPIWMKSNKERVEPREVMPYKEIAEPMRVKLRIDIPYVSSVIMVTKSQIEMQLPMRPCENRLIELPNLL